MRVLVLPDEKVLKIYLIGSSIKGDFGEYKPPGFRGSLYSDFDFIVFVEDDFIIPEHMDRESDARPFPDNDLNLAYRIRRFVAGTYDAEVFFVQRSTMNNAAIAALAEAEGCEIPFSEQSRWPFVVVYQQ